MLDSPRAVIVTALKIESATMDMTEPNEGDRRPDLVTALLKPLEPIVDETPTEAVKQIEAEAAEAAEQVRRGNDFLAWAKIGKGLVEGRNFAMRKAGTNQPVGARYNRAFSDWKETRRWAQWDKATTNHSMWLADNLDKVNEFRATLSENVRLMKNHPTTVRRAWDAAFKPKGDKGERSAETKAAKTEAELESLAAERDKWKRQAEAAEEFEGVPYDASVDIIVGMFAQNVTQSKLVALGKAITAEAARRAKIKNGKAPK